MGGRQVLQTLPIQAERQSWEQEIHPNDKRDITGNKVLQTEEWACTDWTIPKAVLTLRGQPKYMTCKWSTVETGASLLTLLPLLPVERPADCALEGGGKGYCMESELMPACADIRAIFDGKMRSSGDGHPTNYWRLDDPAKTSCGARAGSKVFGPAAVSLYWRWSLCSFELCVLNWFSIVTWDGG